MGTRLRTLLFLLFCSLFVSDCLAEGSKDMFRPGAQGSRAAMFSSPRSTAVIIGNMINPGRMFVYARTGEIIHIGSSAQGLNSGTMTLIAPDGQTYSSGNSTLTGRINNRSEELAGPAALAVGGYVPFSRTVASGQQGIWTVEFTSPNPNGGPAGSISLPAANANWAYSVQQNLSNTAFIVAWDITVASGASARPGRVFMNVFTGTTGSSGGAVFSEFNILTKDGYVYQVNSNGIQPFAFAFFVNNKGTRSRTNGESVYTSVYLPEALPGGTYSFQDPTLPDDATNTTHKLFYNTIDNSLPLSAPVWRNGNAASTWLLATPIKPEVTDLTFVGREGTPGVSGTPPLNGGNIRFNANQNGNAKVSIDVNNNGVFTDPVDRIIIAAVQGGQNTIFWDGKDGTGADVANNTDIRVDVVLYSGEVHFPYLDVEFNQNGLNITRINGDGAPNSFVYWNDVILNRQTGESNPRDATAAPGINSFSNGHIYGNSYGNDRLMDTWTYIFSSPATINVTVQQRQADLEVVNNTPNVNLVCAGSVLTYTSTVRNNGPDKADGATYTFAFPAEYTGATVTPQLRGGAVITSSGIANNVYTAKVNLPNGASIDFRITGRASSVPAGGNLTTKSSVVRPADVTDPDATNGNTTGAPSDADTECNGDPSGPGCNNIKSSTVTVSPPITSNTIASAQSICKGATAAPLTGNAVDGTPVYRWESSTTGSNTGFTSAAGTNNGQNYTLPAAPVADTWFRRVVTAGGCSDTSSAILIKVNPPLTAGSIGDDQTFCGSGDPAAFRETAKAGGGTGTYTYQWQSSTDNNTFIDIADATGATYNAPAVSQTTYFRRLARSENSGCTEAVSNVVRVLVDPTPTTASAGADQTQYNSGVFSLSANAPATGTGQWAVVKGQAAIADASAPNTTATLQPNTSATLTWTVTNGSCPPSVDSVVLTYSYAADLKVTKSGTDNTYKTGSSLTYTITIENAGPSDVNGAVVRDALPQAMENVSWTSEASGAGTSLQPASGTGRNIEAQVNIPFASGNKIVLTVTGKLADTTKGGNVVENTASLSLPENMTDPDESNNTSTVTGTVPNNPPIAEDDHASTKRDVPVNGSVLGNDRDPDGDRLTVSTTPASPPAHGKVQINPDGTFTYTPDPGFTGSDSFVYEVCDEHGACTRATVTIVVDDAVADLAVEKTSNPTQVVAGEALEYIITVRNNGPSTLHPSETFTVKDQLPQGFTAETFAPSAGSFDPASGNWTGVTLAPGNKVTLAIKGKVAPDYAGGSLKNVVDVLPPPNVTDPTENTATVETPVTRAAEVVVEKTDNSDVYTPGEKVTYTITVTNRGPSQVAGLRVTDPLPAGISTASWTYQFTADAQESGTGTGPIDMTMYLPVGGSVIFKLTLDVPSSHTGQLTNTAAAIVPEGYTNINPAGNTATDTDAPKPLYGVRVTKTGPAEAVAGEGITYQLKIYNEGPSDLRGAAIKDELPDNLLNAEWTVAATGAATSSVTSGSGDVDFTANLPAGAANELTVTIKGTVNQAATGELKNTAGVQPPGQPAVSSNQVITTIRNKTGLSVSKESIPAGEVTAGSPVQYRVRVTNAGPSNATAVAIEDVVPAAIREVQWHAESKGSARLTGTTSGNGNNINTTADIPAGAGHEILITIDGVVDPSATGKVLNTATATPQGGTASSGSNEVTVDNKPGLKITKTGPAQTDAGSGISYRITILNEGPSDAVDAVITDEVPALIAGTSWKASATGKAAIAAGATGNGNSVSVTGNIPAGAGNTIVIDVTGTVEKDAAGTIVNTAQVVAGNDPPVLSDTAKTTINNNPGLTISKSGPSSAIAGEHIEYTITVGNTGPSDAFNAVLTDTVPTNIRKAEVKTAVQGDAVITSAVIEDGVLRVTGDFPAGSEHQAIITLSGDIDPAFSGTLRNQAAIASGNKPPVRSEEVRTTVTSEPVLVLTKSAPDTIAAGQRMTYTVVLTNEGLSDALDVTISDGIDTALTNVSWTAEAAGRATVASGASGTGNSVSVKGAVPAGTENRITVLITGTVSPGAEGKIVNVATAEATGVSPVNSNNVTTVVENNPGVRITKSAPRQATAGGGIVYTLDVVNTGPSDAKNVKITDQLPSQLETVEWQTSAAGGAAVISGGTGNGNNLEVMANIPAVDGRITITIEAKIRPDATGKIINEATAQAEGAEPVTAAAETQLSIEPMLAISKSGPGKAFAGEEITYTLTAGNTGVSDAGNIVIEDLVPPELTAVSWSAESTGNASIVTNATGAGNKVRLTGSLPAGAGNRILVTITGRIKPDYNGTLANTADLFQPGIDSARSETVNTQVTNFAGLVVTKTGFDTLAAGNAIRYEVTIANHGPSDAKNVNITDIVDPHITNVTWSVTAAGDAVAHTGSGTGNNVAFAADIPAGTAHAITVRIDGTTDPSYSGDIKNVATVTAPGQEPVESDTVTTHMLNQPSLAITKAGPEQTPAGGRIAWVITISNNGPSDAFPVEIRDTVPEGVTGVTWSATANGTSTVTAGESGSGNIISVTGNIRAGAGNTVLLHVNGTVKPGEAAGVLTNTATAAVPGQPPVTDTAATAIIISPDLQLVKTAPDSVSAGDKVTYTITLTNNGPSDAVNVAISDTLHAALQNVTWTAVTAGAGTAVSAAQGSGNAINLTGTIPAGAGYKITLTATGTLDPGFTGNAIGNTAYATPPGLPAVSSTVNTGVNRHADLLIVKTGPKDAVAGEHITYRITVTNNGPANASGVSITDVLPPALTGAVWTVETTGAGTVVSTASGSGNVDLVADIPAKTGVVEITVNATIAPDAAAGEMNNTATATLPPGQHDPTPASSTVSTNVTYAADLEMVKSGPANLAAGQEITWTLTVKNRGISDVPGAVIKDVVPAEVTIRDVTAVTEGNATAGSPVVTGNEITIGADIAAGAGNTITVMISGTVSSSATGSITNTAGVTPPANVRETNPANNTSAITTGLTTDVGVQLSKSGPATVNAGDVITYTILLQNTGVSDANGVIVTDDVPADITNVTWTASATGTSSVSATSGSGNQLSLTANLGANSSGQITITITGTVSNGAGNTIVNTAEAEYNGEKTSQVTTAVNHSANLRISKSGPASIAAGQPITYIVKVVNAGPSDVRGALIEDKVPAGITNINWTAAASNGAGVSPASGTGGDINLLADIRAGLDTITLIVKGMVEPGFTGTLVNTATAEPPAGIVNPVPAEATVSTDVTNEPGLSLVKSGPGQVQAGGVLTYRLDLYNHGPSNASGVTLRDTLPAGLNNITWTVEGAGTPASGTDRLVVVSADLPVDGRLSVLISGTVDPAASGSLVNRAVAGDGKNDVVSNTVNTTIINQPGLQVSKSGPADIYAGQPVNYVISITNAGPSTAKDAAVSDLMPAGITNVTWSAAAKGNAAIRGGDVSNGTGDVAFTADIPAGSNDQVLITVSGRVAPDFTGALKNTVTVTPAGSDPVSGSVTSNVTRMTGVRILKAGPDSVLAGARMSYVLEIYNYGPSDATGISISDAIPVELQGATWSASTTGAAAIAGGNITNRTGNVAFTADVPAGAENSVQVRITGVVDPSYSGTVTNTASAVVNGEATNSNTVDTRVVNQPGLRLTKSGPSKAIAGGGISYALTLTNSGPSNASGVTVSDQLPAEIGAVQWSATARGSATINGGNISNRAGNVAFVANVPAGGGNRIDVTVTGTIAPSFTGMLTNTASHTSGGVTMETPPVNTAVEESPSLAIRKSAPDTVAAGSTIVYTLVVTNNGPSDAGSVNIEDQVPAAIRNVQWSTTARDAVISAGNTGAGNNVSVAGRIAAGGSIRVTISGIADAAAGGVIQNHAVASNNGRAPVRDSASTRIINVPGVHVEKSGPQQINAGGVITYEIDVTNAGPSNLVNALVTDLVPSLIRNVAWRIETEGGAALAAGTPVSGSGNLVAFRASVPAGSGHTVRMKITGTANPDSVGTIVNTAVVRDTAGREYSGSATTAVTMRDRLQIIKTGPSSVSAGENINYRVMVTNAGPSNARGITITDVVPADIINVRWVAVANGQAAVTGNTTGTGNNISITGDIAAGTGNSIQLLIQGMVPADGNVRQITNTASLQRPDGTMETTPPVVTAIVRQTRIAVVKQAPVNASAGDSIRFLITVSNAGPATAAGVTIADEIAEAVQGASWTATANGAAKILSGATGNGRNVHVQADLPAGTGNTVIIAVSGRIAGNFTGRITNTAQVTNGEEAIPSNTTQTNVASNVPPVANLAVSKSGPAGISLGQRVVYTIVARNYGPAAAGGAVVTDELPPSLQQPEAGIVATTEGAEARLEVNGNRVTVTLPRFPADAVVRVSVSGIATDFTALRNTASISVPPGITDPDEANNVSVAQTNVYGGDVQVRKQLTGAPSLIVGGKANFSIEVRNNGPAEARTVTVRDTLRANLEVIGGIDATMGTVSYNPVTRILVWTTDVLMPSEVATIQYVTRIVAPGKVVNSATAGTVSPDPEPGNNTDATEEAVVTGDDIFIPNVITPNGDGRNDRFVIVGIDRFPESRLFIYNRWGNEVYRSGNYQNTWDGRGLNEGTYYYVLKLNTPGGEKAYKGWIELLR